MFDAVSAFIGSALLIAFAIFLILIMILAVVGVIMLITWTPPEEVHDWIVKNLLERRVEAAKAKVIKERSSHLLFGSGSFGKDCADCKKADAELENAQAALEQHLKPKPKKKNTYY
jgi:hypothetical protein